MTQEQLLQAANPSLMKAFFLLNELKSIYYANLTDLARRRKSTSSNGLTVLSAHTRICGASLKIYGELYCK